jgi:RNA polymerase sigma-70 factor (ECF subfamily)
LSNAEVAIDRLFRQNAGRVVATIAKAFGDIQIGEDAVQEAYIRLLKLSESAGLPENPQAWVMRAARNCAIDRLRRSVTQSEIAERVARLELAIPDRDAGDSRFSDDRLELIFACCHPALTLESRVALTLRSVCGLTTRQIASAFFVPETTMTRRLARAKRKLREAGVSFALPAAGRLAERLDSVLGAIYLIFNEGYKASGGAQLTNVELCEEAIWLAGLLHQLLPREAEALGLYCLLLFSHSRHATRVAPSGAVEPLEFQDRSRWDMTAINTAAGLLVKHGPLRPTTYVIEAEIAAHHATAERYEDTDWTRIAALYEMLAILNKSPAVELNRAIAVGMALGYERGLAALDSLSSDPVLRDHYLLHAGRADFLRRLGRSYEATVAYSRALSDVPTLPERIYLEERLRELDPDRK